MATMTTAMLRIFIGSCLLYHVTLVTGDDDYMTAEDVTPTAYKCFQVCILQHFDASVKAQLCSSWKRSMLDVISE